MPRITATSCPVLRNSEIHIHLIPPENVEQVSSDTYLDEDELNREQQLILEKDRFLFRASHIFLRQLLSCYGKLRPENWQFKRNSHGKPELINSGYQHLKFNLSHTLGLIAVAIGQEHNLGVDIEQHRPIKELSGLCRYSLSETECQNVLLGSNEALKKQRFYRYWTMKEAYAKARGKGLSFPLQDISFAPGQNDQWTLHTNQDTGAEQKNIRLLCMDFPKGYSLALAAEYQAANKQPDIQLNYWGEHPSHQALGFNVFPA